MDGLHGEKLLNYNAMNESQVIDLIPNKSPCVIQLGLIILNLETEK